MSMSMSSLLVVIAVLCSSVVVHAELPATCATKGCIGSIGNTQECLRICQNALPPGGPYAGINRFLNCTNDVDYSSATSTDFNNLVTCCGMDDPSDVDYNTTNCDTTIVEAQECYTTDGCIDSCLVETARNYQICLLNAKSNGSCPFTDWCSANMFNNPLDDEETGEPVLGTVALDFNTVLNGVTSAALTSETCEPIQPFVTKICSLGNSCCSACDDQLGDLTECLINNFMLPLYELENSNIDVGLQCVFDPAPDICGFDTSVIGFSTTNATRGLEPATTSGSSGTAPASAPPGGIRRVTEKEENLEVIGRCMKGLEMNVLVHNETYAAGEFMNCQTLNMAEIVVLQDDDQPETSSSATASRMVAAAAATTFSFVAAMMTT